MQQPAEEPAAVTTGPPRTFLSFVHRFVDLDEIVGGEQVRPYELFTSLASLGHDVHVYERHNAGGRTRRYGRLVVRPLPLPSNPALRKVLFWPVLYAVFLVELLRARDLCLYQTLPWGAKDLRRLELLPAYVLFWAASRLGAVTWGALQDLPYDHFEYGRSLDEQDMKEDADGALARKAAHVQMRQVQHADFVTVVSENMRRLVVARAEVDPEKVCVFRSAVNPDQVAGIPPWHGPEDRPWRIGFLGHAADAQLPLLADAIALLAEKDRRVEVVLAGRGTPELALEVTCFGDVIYKDFAAFARDVDVWVIPYADLDYLHLAWQLKPPMNVASGRPVVMTQTDETPHSGLSPYLYLAGSTPASIAEQIEAVLDDPEAARDRALAGRDYLLSEMTWRHVTARLVDSLP